MISIFNLIIIILSIFAIILIQLDYYLFKRALHQHPEGKTLEECTENLNWLINSHEMRIRRKFFGSIYWDFKLWVNSKNTTKH